MKNIFIAVIFIASTNIYASEKEEDYLSATDGKKKSMGAWYAPPLPMVQDRMQSIHAALMPNGKVLIVNGSSNRNTITDDNEVVLGVNVWSNDTVNNSALFDPSSPLGTSGITRIASPPTKIGEPNDLFCSGQMHLPNGNLLFVGGTRGYYEGDNFRGSKNANIYDWQKNKWLEAGQTQDGHWYPTLVPLANGDVVAMSGIHHIENAASNTVEIFKYSESQSKDWMYVDISKLPNSPVNTVLPDGSIDMLQLYPRAFSMADGSIYITGDGAALGNMKSNKTYMMTVDTSSQKTALSFRPGPERVKSVSAYSTALVDPDNNDGNILLIGGMRGSDNIHHNSRKPVEKADVHADMEKFNVADKKEVAHTKHDLSKHDHNLHDHGAKGRADGYWEHFPDFLGSSPEHVRIMSTATILPTKEFLVMGGGNYAFEKPIHTPLLFTLDEKGVYKKRIMNPGKEPRLYHSVSLLLPDGRVFVAGGNASKAGRKADGTIKLAMLRDLDSPTWQDLTGKEGVLPAEIWQVELFYPPYLFIDKTHRPEILNVKTTLHYGETSTASIKHMTNDASMTLIKLGSVTHGWDSGQRLYDLKIKQDIKKGNVTFLAPDNANLYPPGYYMLFYVNKHGQPSVAEIIRLS